MKELKFSTSKQFEVIDITKEVSEAVKEIKEGIAVIFVPHATAGIIINENYDPKVSEDIITALNQIVPLRNNWKHDQVDGNAAAHIKSAIIGPSETVIIKDGKMQLGTWQQIALIDFDGPRERKVFVKTIK